MKNKIILKALPLFLLIFIDSMGLGLVFPIITSVIMNPHSDFLSHATSLGLRNFYYGFTISTFMICWFFGAAFLGDLSDSIGRKKSLMICLIGAVIGYLISAMGITFHSLLFLILGRMIAGVTAGSQAIAQAAVIDLSSEEDRTKNLGLVMFSASLGFVLGPIIGGTFSDTDLVSWFNLATPMYFAAILSLVNLSALLIFYKEKFINQNAIKIRWLQAINIFISAFTHKNVRAFSISLFIGLFAWSSYYTFVSSFLLQRFDLSTQGISLYLALMACGFAISTTYLIRVMDRFFSEEQSIMFGLGFAAIAALFTFLSREILFVWLWCLPLSMSVGVFYTLIISRMSKQVSDDQQGWIMGITNSVGAAAFGLSGFVLAVLLQSHIAIAILLSGIGFLIATVYYSLKFIIAKKE